MVGIVPTPYELRTVGGSRFAECTPLRGLGGRLRSVSANFRQHEHARRVIATIVVGGPVQYVTSHGLVSSCAVAGTPHADVAAL